MDRLLQSVQRSKTPRSLIVKINLNEAYDDTQGMVSIHQVIKLTCAYVNPILHAACWDTIRARERMAKAML